jgi:AbrB family looped-hinge helix DNA binding protein
MTIATVTSKGQVTIPKDVRDALHIKAGDRLQFTVRDDGTVLVRPRTVDIMGLVGMLKAKRHVTIEEMNETIAKGWAGELPRDRD